MRINKAEIRKKARTARRSLGFSDTEPLDIAKVLRLMAGISLAKKPFEGTISGLFLRGQNTSLILINSRRTVGHQHFTMAHEYYHLLYEPELDGSVCVAGTLNPSGISERAADYFAAEFLIPKSAVDEAVDRLNRRNDRPLEMADLIELEQLFGVSHHAMRYRLRDTGHITKKQSERLANGVKRAAWALGFDLSLYSPTDDCVIMSPYPKLAGEALQKGIISSGKYREMMVEAGFFDLVFGETEQPWDAHES